MRRIQEYDRPVDPAAACATRGSDLDFSLPSELKLLRENYNDKNRAYCPGREYGKLGTAIQTHADLFREMGFAKVYDYSIGNDANVAVSVEVNDVDGFLGEKRRCKARDCPGFRAR